MCVHSSQGQGDTRFVCVVPLCFFRTVSHVGMSMMMTVCVCVSIYAVEVCRHVSCVCVCVRVCLRVHAHLQTGGAFSLCIPRSGPASARPVMPSPPRLSPGGDAVPVI